MLSCFPRQGASSMTPYLYFSLGLIQALEAVQGTIMVSIMPYIVSEFYAKDQPFITAEELATQVGRSSGILSGSFFLAAFFSSFLWGWASDKIGRRPVLLSGTAASIVATALFAVSNTFMYALAVRFLIGLLNGNLGVLKSYLGEVTTSENQASAFAFIAVVYAAASVVSPLAGGILGGKAPGMPYAFLPGIVSAVFAAIVFVLSFIFLPETSAFLNKKQSGSIRCADCSATNAMAKEPSQDSISAIIRDRGVVLATITYATVCILHIATVTLLPILFQALGMSSTEVGVLFAVEGAALCAFQMFCYPKLAKKFGIISLLRLASILLSFSLLLPLACLYTANVFPIGHWATTIPLMLIVGLPTTTSFTCSNLLVNNSASSENRGAVNGLGQTLACVSRSLGPVLIGTLWDFSIRMKAPYMPFLVLFILSFSLYGLALLTPPSLLHPKAGLESLKSGSDINHSAVQVELNQNIRN